MNNRIAKKLFWVYLVSFIACAFLYSVSSSQAATAIEAEGAPSGFDQTLQPATMDWEQAEQLCAGRGGALPTVEQLQAIAGETGSGSYAAHAWPERKAIKRCSWGTAKSRIFRILSNSGPHAHRRKANSDLNCPGRLLKKAGMSCIS